MTDQLAKQIISRLRDTTVESRRSDTARTRSRVETPSDRFRVHSYKRKDISAFVSLHVETDGRYWLSFQYSASWIKQQRLTSQPRSPDIKPPCIFQRSCRHITFVHVREKDSPLARSYADKHRMQCRATRSLHKNNAAIIVIWKTQETIDTSISILQCAISLI